jgi:uncharacterized metal-binding protein
LDVVTESDRLAVLPADLPINVFNPDNMNQGAMHHAVGYPAAFLLLNPDFDCRTSQQRHFRVVDFISCPIRKIILESE